VTVQIVKTGITPQLATSDRWREAETEPLHPAGRLHMLRGGTPRRCAAVASTSPPPSSYFRQSVSPLRSACQSSPCARAHRDGSTSLQYYSSVPRLRPGRRSTTPHAASKCPGMSLRSSAHHSDCRLPTVAPLPDAAGSCRSETLIVSMCPHAPDATTSTSGAPVQVRLAQSPRSAHHGRASLQSPAANVPSTPDATALDTNCRRYNDR